MTNTRTNPAYAYLAYRRAIIQELVGHLQNQYLGARGDDVCKLTSDQVFPVDAEVPLAEVEQFVAELLQKDAFLELEMAKFEFTKKENQNEQQPAVQKPKAQKSARVSKKKGRKAISQG